MSTIDSLNNQYITKLKIIDTLQLYLGKIVGEQNNSRLSDTQKASISMKYLDTLLEEVDDGGEYVKLRDIVSVGAAYFACFTAINDYKDTLFNINNGVKGVITNEIKKIKESQENYVRSRDMFRTKYNYQIDAMDSLNQVIIDNIKDAVSSEQKTIEQLKNEARTLVNRENTIVLKMTDSIHAVNQLPDSMLVARYPVQHVTQAILKDIGINSTYKNIDSELRSQGNVIVNADFKDMADEQIDAFIMAYIFRFMEIFPLGVVHVHIFDQNANYLYKRLNNSFKLENAGETVKKIVRIHSSLKELSDFRDVICDDIFRKTSSDKPDLYSIFEHDQSDSFNLIIIRDGFVDGSGYVAADILDTINSLTKPEDLGHICGLRFLIIDNSSSFAKNLTENSKYLINSIQGNCENKFNYIDGEFLIDNKKTEVLQIQGNLDLYVQERAKAIADAIGKKEKNYISLDDICASEIDENLGNIMYIPVGMSGGKIVELPLSCKDEDGTVAGQCIGYMAIGQSGSGKSSFFHSVVLNGCMKYSPRDIQFWLLDFKNGGASSKYSNCGIPHVKIIAENNKIDDALCLFQMVLEEMERRSRAFNRNHEDNIIDYNKKANAKGLEYFPRIIIAIDEVQEIFREDNASVIQKLISSISTRMRSAGMHFVMVAQNLSDGRTYMLKDAFLPSATGRICFRVAQDIPRDSGFEEEFVERRQEISELKTGEAYVSYGKDTIKKVKIAFISPQDMSDRYFADICGRYPTYSNMRPLVIGSRKRLAITDYQQGSNSNYYDVFRNIISHNGVYTAVIGEDVYRMNPLSIRFSQQENSSVLFLGSDKRIASSLCASTAVSLMLQNVKVHLINGDRTKIQEENELIQHPFMYVCQNIATSGGCLENHRMDQLQDVLRELYSKYLERKAQVQQADDEEPDFLPMFLIVNDLFGIESFARDDMVENNLSELQTEPRGFAWLNEDFNINCEPNARKETGQFREKMQHIISVLLKDGYRYNIHIVLSIKGAPSMWSNSRIVSEVNNMVFFNDTEYVDRIDNAYYLKAMLKNIFNDSEDETMAVWSSKKTFSKIRPIIYNMSIQTEQEALDKLIKGE